MADAPELLASALKDRYRIERELGAGGMATVYLAEDVRHHRNVAVKVLRPELAASLGHSRFLREVAIAANLQHPHIVPLYDSGDAAGFLYYVMPFVEGPSLRQKLVREGELPIPEAVRILREVAEALAHAHERGVVHRDIKPENVMLSGRHALVADFGVAKAIGEAAGESTLTSAGVALGTPTYMAPEQATGDPHVDHRADIYAFGAMAYELLTGRAPIQGGTPQATLAKQITELPEPVTNHRPNLPPALAGLVMQCLAKKPADRVQSAEEIVAQLETVLTPTGGVTPVATPPVALTRSSTRRSGLALLALVPLLVVALLLGRPRSTAPVFTAQPTQLTFEGNVEEADLSPDGQWLAYVAGGGLWIRDLGGGAPFRLASAGLGPVFPLLRWSPDGASLLYSGRDSTGMWRSMVFPRLGGPPRASTTSAGNAAWSPDGLRLALWSNPASGPYAPIRILELKSGAEWRIPLPDSIGPKYGGDWSPAGDVLTFLSRRDPISPRRALWSLQPADSTLRLLFEDSVTVADPRFVARDRRLYVLRDGGLWVFETGGDGLPRGAPVLVRLGLNASRLAVSADGRRFMYVVRNSHRNLWIVPDGAGPPIQLTRGTASIRGVPSPDGRLVAYTAAGDLFVIPVSGGAPQQLTSSGAAVSGPAWSPDGGGLVFTALVNGTRRIRSIALDSRAEHTFQKTEVGVDDPQWSPDTRIFYQRAGNGNWHFLEPRTGTETPLLQNDTGSVLYQARVSPNLEWVAAYWYRPERGGSLWLLSLRDTTRRLLFSAERPVGWASDGRFVRVSGGLMVAVDGSWKTQPDRLPTDPRYDGCIPFRAPSGRVFLCGVTERSNDVWLLEVPKDVGKQP